MRSLRNRHLLRCGLPAVTLELAATQAGAQSYTFTDLGVLAGTASSGHGINAAGDVAGRSTSFDGSTTAALWKNGSTSDLGSLGAGGGIAIAVNDAGLAVGSSRSLPGSHSHATLWTGNAATDLGTLGGSDSVAYALNNAGHAVGYSYARADNAIAHAVLWDGGQLIDLKPAGDSASVANGINSSQPIAGYPMQWLGAAQVSPTSEPSAARTARSPTSTMPGKSSASATSCN